MDKKSLFLLAASGIMTFSGLSAANSYSAKIAEQQTKVTTTSSTSSTNASNSTSMDADDQNAELVQKIQSSIKGNYSNFNLNVRINNGKVFLTGSVATQADKNSIESDVSRMNGVKSVVNDLKVRDANMPSPRS